MAQAAFPGNFRNAPAASPGDHRRAPRRGSAQVAVRVAVAGLDEEADAEVVAKVGAA